MSSYVISDIHGCYSELLSMLKKICFCETDRLEELDTDFSSHADTAALYESVKYLFHNRDRDADAKLACIRLEDEKIFYI